MLTCALSEPSVTLRSTEAPHALRSSPNTMKHLTFREARPDEVETVLSFLKESALREFSLILLFFIPFVDTTVQKVIIMLFLAMRGTDVTKKSKLISRIPGNITRR